MYNAPLLYKYGRLYLNNGRSSTGKNIYLYFILYFTILVCHSFCLFYVLIIIREHLLIFNFKCFTYMMTVCVWTDIVTKGWHYATEKSPNLSQICYNLTQLDLFYEKIRLKFMGTFSGTFIFVFRKVYTFLGLFRRICYHIVNVYYHNFRTCNAIVENITFNHTNKFVPNSFIEVVILTLNNLQFNAFLYNDTSTDICRERTP